MNLKDCAGRYPARVFFCLAFVLSWGGALLIGGPGFLRGEAVAPEDLWAMGAAGAALGP